MARGNLLTNEAKSRMKDSYALGVSSTKIAREHGVSTPTVLSTLREMGVEIRGRGRRKADKTVAPRVTTPVVEPGVDEPVVEKTTSVFRFGD